MKKDLKGFGLCILFVCICSFVLSSTVIWVEAQFGSAAGILWPVTWASMFIIGYKSFDILCFLEGKLRGKERKDS